MRSLEHPASRGGAAYLLGLIGAFERAVLGGGVMLVAGLTVVNVLLRTFRGRSLASLEEVSGWALVAITFVGLSYAASQGRHIRMSALYDTLPSPARRRLRAGICACTALLLLVLDYYAVRYLGTVRELGSVSPVLQAPVWWTYLAAPAGLTLAAFQYLLAAWVNLRGSEDGYLAYGVPDSYEPPMDGL